MPATLSLSKDWTTASSGTSSSITGVDVVPSQRVFVLAWAYAAGGPSVPTVSNSGTSLGFGSAASTLSGDIRVTMWNAYHSTTQSGLSITTTYSSSVFQMICVLGFTDTTGGTAARTSSTGSSNPQTIPGGTTSADEAYIVFVGADANFGDATSSDATYSLTTTGGGPIAGYRGPLSSGSSTGVSLASSGSPAAWAWAARELYGAAAPAVVRSGWGVIK